MGNQVVAGFFGRDYKPFVEVYERIAELAEILGNLLLRSSCDRDVRPFNVLVCVSLGPEGLKIPVFALVREC